MLGERLKAYVELTKPKIVMMVLVTTVWGFALVPPDDAVVTSWPLLLLTLIGTGLCSGGAGAWNHYMEYDVDAKMERTKRRPIPLGTIAPWEAVVHGVVFVGAGTLVLGFGANWLAAALGLTSALLYAFVYTPLKRRRWWNTPVGAVPGAIPPLIGWAAASGTLGAGAFVLFFIMFLWQHPHFYAIAWRLKDDYARGGLKMLPVVEPDGGSTFRHSLACAIILIPVSLWPTFLGRSGWIYFFAALVCGFWFLWVCIRWWQTRSPQEATRVLRVSVIYLPTLLLAVLIDALIALIP